MKLTFTAKQRNDPDNNSNNYNNSNDACNSSCFKYAGNNRAAA